MIPPPPISTLFPYTTLFRSIGVALGGAIFTENVFSLPGLGQTGLDSINNFDLPVTQGIIVFATFAIITLDRKSTRLNSSHVSISYAVFCLKKKNTIHAKEN